MEPRIQYATATDGVSIAFWMLGEGMSFVHISPLPFSHIEMEWHIPELRRWHERLGENRRLIRYDTRGSGLSDRNITDFSLNAMVVDLEAVADRLDLGRFALLGYINSGPVAIAYAARHPERVSHLLLWCSSARPSLAASPQTEAVWRLIDTDWQLFTETLAHALGGWAGGSLPHRLASMMQESVTQESAPGEVLVSETVRSLARTSAGVSFEDRGEQALKGVGEPVRVWAVVETE